MLSRVQASIPVVSFQVTAGSFQVTCPGGFQEDWQDNPPLQTLVGMMEEILTYQIHYHQEQNALANSRARLQKPTCGMRSGREIPLGCPGWEQSLGRPHQPQRAQPSAPQGFWPGCS